MGRFGRTDRPSLGHTVSLPPDQVPESATRFAEAVLSPWNEPACRPRLANYFASWPVKHVDVQLTHTRGKPLFWNWEVTVALFPLEPRGIAEAHPDNLEIAKAILDGMGLSGSVFHGRSRLRSYWDRGRRTLTPDCPIPGHALSIGAR